MVCQDQTPTIVTAASHSDCGTGCSGRLVLAPVPVPLLRGRSRRLAYPRGWGLSPPGGMGQQPLPRPAGRGGPHAGLGRGVATAQSLTLPLFPADFPPGSPPAVCRRDPGRGACCARLASHCAHAASAFTSRSRWAAGLLSEALDLTPSATDVRPADSFFHSQQAHHRDSDPGAMAWGGYSLSRLPIDAVPDITTNQVVVYTVAPSLAAGDIERLVSFPVEQSLATIPGREEVRSFSRFGLSVVTIVFEDDVDIYWARQQVAERLREAESQIPAGIGRPEMAPSAPAWAKSTSMWCAPSPASRRSTTPASCAPFRTGSCGASCWARPAWPTWPASAASSSSTKSPWTPPACAR